MKKKLLFLIGFCLHFLSAFPQSTIINDYFQVTAVGVSTATVTNLTGINGIKTLAKGDTVLIIQMQGATIDESNTASFGNISHDNAGNYELNVICDIDVPTNTVKFYYNLLRPYTPATGSVQIVTHTDGKALDVVLPAVSATAWNGNVGGVVFIKAKNTVTLTGNIDVTGKGFRGGDPGGILGPPATVCNKNVVTATGTWLWNNDGCNGATENASALNYYYPKLSVSPPDATGNHLSPPTPAIKPANLMDQYRAGWKGEGIAKFILGKEMGRGAQANGGGGGHTHNSGGGGGGSAGSGGLGGKPWDGSMVAINGGIGGRFVGFNQTRLFMGGGGGGGHGNYPNGNPSKGGNGGGVVIIKCDNLILPAPVSIISNGESVVPKLDGDSEGGGGAGGCIYMEVTTLTGGANLALSVAGGKGGDAINAGDCIGAGGGGGGGMIMSKVLVPTAKNIQGGLNGEVTGVTNTSKPCSAINDPTWGAFPGANGSAVDGLSSYKIPQSTTLSSNCTLPVSLLSYDISSAESAVHLAWETAMEINNHYFVVERSKDGISFEAIANVKGIGNSKSMKRYSAIDWQPLNGISFYRLKQVDIDGTSSYSPIRSIEMKDTELALNIFPVPSHNREVNLTYFVPGNTDVEIRILNAIGQVVYSKKLKAIKGRNENSFSLEGAVAGLYMVYVYAGNQTEFTKVIFK